MIRKGGLVLANTFVNGSTSKTLGTVSAAFFVMLGVAGCSADVDSGLATNAQALESSYTYQDWCQSWALSCPTQTTAGFPSDAESWSVDQWRAVSKIAGALLASRSSLVFTRQDLNDANLQQIAANFQWSDLYTRVSSALDSYAWQTASKEATGQSLRMTFQQATSKQLPIGVLMGTSPQVDLSVSEDSKMDVAGLSLARSSEQGPGAPDDIRYMLVNSPNTVDMNFASANRVTGMPIRVLLDQFLGQVGASPSDASSVTLESGIRALGPLMTWLIRADRVIDLDRGFFTTVAAQAPTLLGTQGRIAGLYPVLGAMNSLLSNATPGSNMISASIAPGKKLNCSVKTPKYGNVSMVFSDSFGIKSHKIVNSDTVSLEFYGLKASFPRILGISFTVKRMDISPETLTIRDLPIIRSYDLKVADLWTPETEISCTN